MQSKLSVEELKAEYDADDSYFAMLSDWHTSGKFRRRTRPIIKQVRRYLTPSSIVLDAGCAAGAMTIELARLGVQSVHGVDFAATALRYAHSNVQRYRVADRVQLIDSQLEALPQPENTYDLIMAADVIEHITRPEAFLAEMYRVCKPGGVLVIETPNTLFRQHPWYHRIVAFCRRFGLPESENLFPVEIDINWEHYHVSLMPWPTLAELVTQSGWHIVQESPFGWWLKLGAADQVMRVLSAMGGLVNSTLRYYGNTDVIIIAHKPMS